MIAFVNEKETNNEITSIEAESLELLIGGLSLFLNVSQSLLKDKIHKINDETIDLELNDKIILIRPLDKETNEYLLV